jgi:hypothetical protein
MEELVAEVLVTGAELDLDLELVLDWEAESGWDSALAAEYKLGRTYYLFNGDGVGEGGKWLFGSLVLTISRMMKSSFSLAFLMSSRIHFWLSMDTAWDFSVLETRLSSSAKSFVTSFLSAFPQTEAAQVRATVTIPAMAVMFIFQWGSFGSGICFFGLGFGFHSLFFFKFLSAFAVPEFSRESTHSLYQLVLHAVGVNGHLGNVLSVGGGLTLGLVAYHGSDDQDEKLKDF